MQKEEALVSIITPTYNHERFIGQCIESVLSQTYQNWEMLIVDDGSTDRTWEIVQGYAAKDKRIRAFHQENMGIGRLAEIYNFALAQTKGELIAILEGDDFWPGNKLHIQVSWHIQYPNIVFSYGNYINFASSTGDETPGQTPLQPGCISGFAWFRMNALRQSGILAVAVMIKKSALLKTNGFIHWPDFPAVDLPTYYALCSLHESMIYVGQNLTGYWRHHQDQVTGNGKKGVAISELALQITLHYYKRLPRLSDSEIDLSEEDIVRARKPGLSDTYLSAVRQALSKKAKKEVLELVPHLWHYGGTKRKIQAIYAYIAVRLGWDMEIILKVAGKFGV